MIPLYDAHNHLQDERLAPLLEEALRDLHAVGLRACVVNGTRESDWPRVAELARRHDWIIPAYGLHPWFLKERSPKWLETLTRLLDENPRARIGEIGLDRWMREPDLADQEEVFAQQLELAAERNLAVTIHCLKAWGALEAALQKYRRPARGFLLHSYGGSAEMAASLARLGGYFSISGYFAHARKEAQRRVFQGIPAERLLIETDAPDMAPPGGGEINDPRNIVKVYEIAASLRGEAMPQLAETVRQNFERLFG
jgi:TatD DNase family protein